MQARRSWKFVAFLPALTLLAVDQGLKRWGIAHLMPREKRALLGMKSIVLGMYYNHTPAGGLSGAWTQVTIPMMLWAALLLTALFRYRRATTAELIGYSCLLAAGLSNLWDQWRVHVVVDTFQIWLGEHKFLPFNLADLAVSLSAGAMGLLLSFRMLRDATRPRRATPFSFNSRAVSRR